MMGRGRAHDSRAAPPDEQQPPLFQEDGFRRTLALVNEMCCTEVAVSTGAMLTTMDKCPSLTLDTFTAENVEVAVSIVMDPGLWFQDPGQSKRLLAERGTKRLQEIHEESLMRLRVAAGGPTAGVNYRTHVGRSDPMCTVHGEHFPPPVAALLTFSDEEEEGDGEDKVQVEFVHGGAQGEGSSSGTETGGSASGVESGGDAEAPTKLPEPEPEPEPAPAPAPPPAVVEDVAGVAAMLRRLAAFEVSPSERVLELRVREGQPRPSYYRTREDSDEVELPQDIASSLSAAQAWLHTHPSPWVRSWEYSDDTTPAAADGEGGADEAGERPPAINRSKPPVMRLAKQPRPPGATIPSDGPIRNPTVVLSAEDFRAMMI